jgi:hypothetical protein
MEKTGLHQRELTHQWDARKLRERTEKTAAWHI